MLIRALLAGCLLLVTAACGLEAPADLSEPASAPPREAEFRAAALPEAPSDDWWGSSRDRTCQHLLDEYARVATPEGERRERNYLTRNYLPNLGPLQLTQADAETARRIFGDPCPGLERAWGTPLSSFAFPNQSGGSGFAAVEAPAVLYLPDGRRVLLAAVTPAQAHIAQGFHAAVFLGSESRQRPYPMEGGGSFGYPGALSAPIRQPLGVFHVWLEGGGTWQGYTQSWATITDFSGVLPKFVGAFRTSAHFPCREYEERSDGVCPGGKAYSLIGLHYSDNGPDDLTLTWRMETFDEVEDHRRINVRERTLVARYQLREVYVLVEGEEPPGI